MHTTSTPPRVVAVVVAWNRRELLREVLDALAVQTTKPVEVVVVDNASTDGSGDVVREHSLVTDLVTLGRNTGGAGGFAAGMAQAMTVHSADWVWLMDDDTMPDTDALTELLAAVDGADRVVMAGSRVLWTDGQEHPMNTPRRKPFVRRSERIAAERRGVLAVRSSSFVSMLVRASVIRERGLPLTDYFIWNDDFEFSTRILRGNRGIFVPASVVVHKTRKLGSTDIDPGERFYNEVRNKVWLLRFSRGLNPAEKLLYGAATVRRWIRTVRHSEDRRVLRHGYRTGMRDGLRTKPRSNTDALAGLGDISSHVAKLEGASRSGH